MKIKSRRDLLKMAGGLAMAAALPSPKISCGGMWNQLFGGLQREVSPITPNEEFYITSYRSPPDVRVENWSLTVKGLVKSPFTLTYPGFWRGRLSLKL